MKKMFQEGDLNAGTISCGQGVGLVKKIMPLKDIIESIIQEANDLRKKLAVLSLRWTRGTTRAC